MSRWSLVSAAVMSFQAVVQKFAFREGEETPSQQLGQYAYHKTVNARHIPSEVVSQMKMVGMKEFKAVQCLSVPNHTVPDKILVGLTARGVPGEVAQTIALELDGAKKAALQWDHIQVDDTGSAHVFRVIARMNCNDGGDCDLAIAAFGASFNAAQEVSHYEEQQIPEYDYIARVIEEFETGFFGRYPKTRTAWERKQVGTRVNKIPIMKQKTFTSDTFEQVKDYLENKAMKEVLLMAPLPQKKNE